MTDETYSQRVARRMAAEIAEFENRAQAKGQTVIDRWWESQRDLQAEAEDIYMVGGFLERRSMNVSFHKSPRDRDW